MGRRQDFSTEEIGFLVQSFIKGLSNTDIREEIQDKTGFPPRSVRSISKIKKIYDAVKKAYEQKLYEANKEKLEGYLHEMAEKAMEGEAGLKIRQAIDIVEHMARGLRPVYDRKTGEIKYETWLEF
jgi:hypothetical protein